MWQGSPFLRVLGNPSCGCGAVVQLSRRFLWEAPENRFKMKQRGFFSPLQHLQTSPLCYLKRKSRSCLDNFDINADEHWGTWGVLFQMLWLHVTFGFMDQLKWKRADPQTPQHLCLSLLLWFTDTDLAEPILLVILYWIWSPGDLLRTPTLFSGLADRAGYSRLSTFFSSLTATRASPLQRRCPVSEGGGWRARAWGGLSLLFVCKNFQSWQMQTDGCLTCLFMEVDHHRYAA